MTPSETAIDLLVIAANSRSLIANRGNLIRETVDAGYKVEAVVPQADYLEETTNLGIPIHLIKMSRASTNPFADIAYMARLLTLIRNRKPARIFGYTSKPVIYGSLAGRIGGVPKRFSMITGLGHIYTSDSRKIRLVRHVMNILYRLGVASSNTVFFQNPDDLSLFTEQGIVRGSTHTVLINGSGVDTKVFCAEPLPTGNPTFLFIGRLLTEKGIAEFVEAAAKVKKDWPSARFVAVGGYDPDLPHSVDAERLESWKSAGDVEFVGAVKDVRPWLKSASVLVHPSYREGTPRAVLEAMSTGRAIITTDAPGCRETVAPGANGVLVPTKEVDPLVDAMVKFLENPSLLETMGAESRRIAEEKYEVTKVNAVLKEAMGL